MTPNSCMDSIVALVHKGYAVVIMAADNDGITVKVEKDGKTVALRSDEEKYGTVYVGRACTVVREVLKDEEGSS